jgi:serine/threonine protein phosphatase PrpC
MSIATLQSVTRDRPLLAEIDVCGLTHAGLVRPTNADHFLVASFHRTLRVHASSLGDAIGPQETQQRGLLLLVADGVGGAAGAGEGARERSTPSRSICCTKQRSARSWSPNGSRRLSNTSANR